ncbi:MAG: hypothetical protein EA401_10990 [Planctomycetota bacterium]|nr:MAG: hypothetical protein EA401_10990 [Planctomycetota bacterium]
MTEFYKTWECDGIIVVDWGAAALVTAMGRTRSWRGFLEAVAHFADGEIEWEINQEFLGRSRRLGSYSFAMVADRWWACLAGHTERVYHQHFAARSLTADLFEAVDMVHGVRCWRLVSGRQEALEAALPKGDVLLDLPRKMRLP